MKHGIRFNGLLAALKEQPVAAADGEARDLGQRVGARLEDDEEDAEGRRDLLEHKAVGHLHLADLARDGLVHGPDLARAIGKLLYLARLELKPVQQRGLAVRLLGGGDVQEVLGQNSRLVRLQCVGDAVQELATLLAGQRLCMWSSGA